MRVEAKVLMLALCCACTPIREFEKPGAAPSAKDGTTTQPSEMSEPDKRGGKGDAAVTTPREDGGKVQPVMTGSAECGSREAGDLYCDAEAKMHVCLSPMSSREVPCGDLERCVMVSGRAQCRCAPGAVLQDSQCVMGTSCAVDNGGCDPLTMCTADAGGRKCGECPAGYAGDGLQGCAPQLTKLEPSCGTLVQPLAAGLYDYRLRAPLLCHALTFESAAPAKTHLTANGVELAGEAASWPLGPLKLGETTVSINVTSEFGVNTKYNLVVERTGAQEAYIKASNAEAEDRFGFNLLADGEAVLVSAPWEDSASTDPSNNAAANSGALYAYTRQNDAWVEQAYLKPSTVAAGDYFGAGMAVAGDTLFVGACGQDPLQWYGGTSIGTRVGVVYVFTRQNGSWMQTARLSPSSGTNGDLFGYAVAVHENTLAIGAPGDSAGGLPKSGAVYLFELEAGAWVEKQKLQAPAAPNGGSFGMALSLEANQLLVGAPTESTRDNLAGAAYLYARSGSSWKMDQRLDPRTTRAETTFGWQVVIHGDNALVGSPGVVRVGPPGELHLFQRSGGAWAARDMKSAAYPTEANLYGGAVRLFDSMLIVGANGDSSGAAGIDADASRADVYQSGAVYLYAPSPTGWVPTTYIKPSNPDENDQFGVRIARANQTLFISAPFESGASRKINGDQSSNTVSQSGAVYVFR